MWFEEIKSDIIDRLGEREGEEICLCDIGFELTISENNTGSWYCSTYKARQEIGEHWEEFGRIAEYMRDNLEDKTNPMLETELFHVRAMITLYEVTFSAAVGGFKEWNDHVEITAEFIERVRESLTELNFCDIF
jgi:hypothetical protein